MHQIRHWSYLKNEKVARDICGVGGSDVYGSALFYGDNSKVANTYTGFGLFKDKKDNLIVVIDENQAKSRELINSGLFGLSETEIWQKCPIIYLGNDRKNLLGKNSSDKYERARILLNGGVSRYEGNWQGEKPTQRNFYDVLENIEKNTKFTEPIFIIRTYSESSIGINDILNVALSISSSFVSAGIVKINPEIFERAKNIVKNVQKYANAETPQDVFTTMAETCEMFVPEWTRGAKAKIERGKLFFGKYVSQAENGFNAIQSGINMLDVQKLSKNIGFDPGEAQKYLANLQAGVFNKPVNLTRITGSLDNVNKTLENINTTYTNKFIEIKNRGGKLVNDIMGQGTNIYQTPVINNLFQSGNASTILAGISSMNEILPALVKKQMLDDKLNRFGANELSGLIGGYFGYVGPEENFKTMTLRALQTTATNYAISKTPFVLPDTIPPKYREEFAKEIKASSGANVITYNDGWDWDSSKRKLVAPAVAIAVAGYYFYKKR